MYYEVKYQYQGVTEAGVEKKLTELILVEAMSLYEAVVIAHKELESCEDLDILSAKRSNIEEATEGTEGQPYFKAKFFIVELNEKTGDEKKSPIYHVVPADDITGAKAKMEEKLAGWLGDTELVAISDTKIVDVVRKDLSKPLDEAKEE
jgi:hypothetical protein